MPFSAGVALIAIGAALVVGPEHTTHAHAEDVRRVGAERASSVADGATAAPAFDLAKFGETVFSQRCSNCHATKAGEQSIAPPLDDIIGRRAGSAPGYSYSPKLAGSDLVWSADSLNSWLAVSTIATPDIRFRHAGLNDAIMRDAVVSYLASLRK